MVLKIPPVFPFLRRYIAIILLFLLLVALAGFVAAQSFVNYSSPGDFSREIRPVFPAALFSGFLESQEARNAARPYWVPTEEESTAMPDSRPFESILLNNDLLIYYGHPLSRNMGILGRHRPEVLKEMMVELAAEYRAAGGKNIILGFYIIYGTVWPGGEIGVISSSVLREWLDFTLENDMLMFIDHQIGRFDPVEQFKTMLPYLRYPNVHLALDPEWRTQRPMQEIGHLRADEINEVQRIMEEYMIENNIPGERLLVIHQFNRVMLRNRENIRADFSKVRLVHCISGIGTPEMKRDTYAFGALAQNIPVKGFKLWYDLGIPGSVDRPLMTPREVLGLNPRPYIMMYQ